MKIITNDNNLRVQLEVWPVDEDVLVHHRGVKVPCQRYGYRIESIADEYGNWVSEHNAKLTGTKFFAYLNEDFCVFSNEEKKLFDSEEFAEYSKLLIGYYFNFLWYRGCRLPNLNMIGIGNTLVHIDWHISKKFTFKITNELGNRPKSFLSDKKEIQTAYLTINWSSHATKLHALVQILKEIYHDEIYQYMYNIADQMAVSDLISSFYIRDPNERDWTKYDPLDIDPPMTLGVFATSYKTSDKTEFFHTKENTRNKSVVMFSPFVFFMDKKELKNLIIHEFIHVKIGAEHRHDSYFWWLYEKYTGESRQNDISYANEIEQQDNQIYDENYAQELTVDEILQKAESYSYCYRKVK